MNNLVYLIILNWNGWQDTIECVESCLTLTYSNFNILIVDNGSTDGSESNLRKRFPNIEYVQTGSNMGFAGGNNIGIRYALDHGAEYIWLLNNDTIVVHETLSELVHVLEQSEKTGIVGSKIFYFNEPNRIWFAGGYWKNCKLYSCHRGENEFDSGQYDVVCDVDYITGCSLLIKSLVIKQIGLMREDYFLYWEETDWNETAFKNGWKILYVPKSLVWHKIGSSFNGQVDIRKYYYIRNALLFFRRHEPKRLFFLSVSIIGRSFKLYINGNKELAKIYIRGFTDFIMRRFGKIR